MHDHLIKFFKAEDGAVTVDWVVLTGGVLAFGLVVTALIAEGATQQSGSIGVAMSNAAVQPVVFD